MIKLVFVTPGSQSNSQSRRRWSRWIQVYPKAIAESGRDIRLDLSWKLCRNETYFDIWREDNDSMRTDQDINNSGSDHLVGWAAVQ